MSILVDFSAVAVSSAMISIAQKVDIDENYIRHVTLNVIRAARKKYFKEYGELVICIDGQNYWRKTLFPFYKANRKAARKDSGVNWPHLFEIIDKIHREIEENFPYKVLKIDTAEADDIIAVLCMKTEGPHIIISNDKDFKQLQRLPGIAMYSPGLSSEVKCENPDTYLVEHIIRGDQSDGIPNVLSDDDTFVNPDKRQKRLTDAKVKEWLTSVPENVFDDRTMENYNRNESLISLFKIPDELSQNIYDAYIDKKVTGHRGIRLMKYFMDKGLRNLVENLDEF